MALPFPPTDHGRIVVVQILRGVAVLLVILIHSINVVDYRFINHIEASPGRMATFRSINEFGACGVDLFFVISGFVMAMIADRNENQNLVRFVRARFHRIVPLYWIISGTYLSLLIVLRISYTEDWLKTTFFIIPGLHYVTPVLVVGWSLAYELVFYALVVLVLKCCRRWRLAALVAITLGFAAAGQLLRPLDGVAAILCNPIIAEFTIGIFCYWMWRRRQPLPFGGAILLTSVGVSLLTATAVIGFDFPIDLIDVVRGDTGAERAGVWALPWAMILLGVLWLDPGSLRRKNGVADVMRPIGDASYSLYLVHMFPCTMAERLLPPGLIPPDALVAVTAGVALVLGLTVHRWLERPLLAALQQSKEIADGPETVGRHTA